VSLHVHAPATDATTVRIPWTSFGGLRVGIVLWGGLALLDAGRLVGLPGYAELGAVALLVTAASLRTRPATGLCTAVTGWLLVDGFVEHRDGVLGLADAHDLGVLALLTGLALVATRARR
jgi:hypothetical protein